MTSQFKCSHPRPGLRFTFELLTSAGVMRRPPGFLVGLHLVRISYVLASFPEPVLARFFSKFANSDSLVSQGACLKGLVAGS